MEKRRWYLVLLQIALWAGFMALPYFMAPRITDEAVRNGFGHHGMPSADLPYNMFISSLVFNVCIIVFFYLHYYIIYDRFAATRRYLAYTATLTVSFAVIFIISHYYRQLVFSAGPMPHRPISVHELLRPLPWFLLVLFVSIGAKLLTQLRLAEQRAREVENANLRTELSMLHAQINPHFLFNSLNTIYSLALKKSDAAPTAVLKLSHLLRYVIDDSTRETVALEQEVNYLNNYIELQKFRSTATTTINFEVKGDVSTTQIAPMLLLPFVENAFKYGISNQQASAIDIKLERSGKTLHFSVHNHKFEHAETESTGIGINNVKRRLELIYHDRYTLTIEDKPDTYFIHLSIKFV